LNEGSTSLEELVLLAVKALGPDAYGVTVQDALERAGQATSLGVIYASLDRLERKGYVEAALGAATAVRGGRRKRLFQPTRGGLSALSEVERIRNRLITRKVSRAT
jgi:PadR family transcriptional regulator, regulatory protein PadR